MFNSLTALGRRLTPWIASGLVLAAATAALPRMSIGAETAAAIPEPAVDEQAQDAAASETVVLSGGCFWGVQGVFQHVKGVKGAVSGYSGGGAATAQYEIVSTGQTGHAESVKVTFDPHQISYGKILQIFFSVAHNPTELNYQGPDHGTQYRSAIFTTSDRQQQIAEAYVAQLGQAKVFSAPIVTKVGALNGFYAAEDYHQNYLTLHPDSPYIQFNDIPKVENLKTAFPDLYREKPVLVDLGTAG